MLIKSVYVNGCIGHFPMLKTHVWPYIEDKSSFKETMKQDLHRD